MVGQRGPVPVPLEHAGVDLTQQVLDKLENATTPLNTSEDFPGVTQVEIKAALDRLRSRSMLVYETKDMEQVQLTAEGEQIADEGSHEFKVWAAVHKAGQLPLKELPVCVVGGVSYQTK